MATDPGSRPHPRRPARPGLVDALQAAAGPARSRASRTRRSVSPTVSRRRRLRRRRGSLRTSAPRRALFGARAAAISDARAGADSAGAARAMDSATSPPAGAGTWSARAIGAAVGWGAGRAAPPRRTSPAPVSRRAAQGAGSASAFRLSRCRRGRTIRRADSTIRRADRAGGRPRRAEQTTVAIAAESSARWLPSCRPGQRRGSRKRPAGGRAACRPPSLLAPGRQSAGARRRAGRSRPPARLVAAVTSPTAGTGGRRRGRRPPTGKVARGPAVPQSARRAGA